MLFQHNQFVSTRRFGRLLPAHVGSEPAAGAVGPDAVGPDAVGPDAVGLPWRRALTEVGFFLFLGLMGWVLLYSL